jgi:adenosylcobyric acid synthase
MLPAEDSLDLFERCSRKPNAELQISVIRLPRIANFTDFDPLDAEPTVSLQYLSLQANLGHPDAVIIPGSKTTIADLLALQASGMAAQLQSYAAAGGTIFGVCGGWQMLGRQIFDPDCLESEVTSCTGLNLLSLTTTFVPEKITRQRQVTSCYPEAGLPVAGYEIHQGVTRWLDGAAGKPIFDDADLGFVSDCQRLWGCYLHGLFDNGSWRRSWLNLLRRRRGLPRLPAEVGNYQGQREVMLDAVADLAAEHLDLELIWSDLFN